MSMIIKSQFTFEEDEKRSRRQGKNIANYISDKGLLSITHFKTQKSTLKKETKQSNRKWAKDTNRYFMKQAM